VAAVLAGAGKKKKSLRSLSINKGRVEKASKILIFKYSYEILLFMSGLYVDFSLLPN
jgi:hypothetical protein